MAYSSTNPARLMVQGGITSAKEQLFVYRSTHGATDVSATGFFTGCGAGGRGDNNIGLKIGDAVLNIESSAGSIPGRATWHGVSGSTADQSSTTASTGYTASYDITVAAHAST